jgi:hypothetical protein
MGIHKGHFAIKANFTLFILHKEMAGEVQFSRCGRPSSRASLPPLIVRRPAPGARMRRGREICRSSPPNSSDPCKPLSNVIVLLAGAFSIVQRSDPGPSCCGVVTCARSGGSFRRSQNASPAIAINNRTRASIPMPCQIRTAVLARRNAVFLVSALLRKARNISKEVQDLSKQILVDNARLWHTQCIDVANKKAGIHQRGCLEMSLILHDNLQQKLSSLVGGCNENDLVKYPPDSSCT